MSGHRCPALFAKLAALVLLQGCAAQPISETLENSTRPCLATLIDDQMNVCLMINHGWRMRVVEHDGPPRWSGPLPIYTPITMKQKLTMGFGFGAFWIGYDGHPFGVVRVAADTLLPTANIQVDTGWTSRRFGTSGTIAVGRRAVYALSEQKLHRIDPDRDVAVTSMEYRLAGDVFADGDKVWLAQSAAVSRLDPETLAVLQTYLPPVETKVGWGKLASLWPERLPDFVRDCDGMKIVLSDYSARGRFPVNRFGRPDATTGTIVVIEGTPSPGEIAPIAR